MIGELSQGVSSPDPSLPARHRLRLRRWQAGARDDNFEFYSPRFAGGEAGILILEYL